MWKFGYQPVTTFTVRVDQMLIQRCEVQICSKSRVFENKQYMKVMSHVEILL